MPARGKHTPLVSVVMSVHNGQRYVGQAIESVLAQTFRDFEFIIIDDGSTDATGGIIESFADPRITTLRRAHNTGLTRSLNEGMNLARGVYLARMDSDDVSLPPRLETQLEYFARNPSLALCATRFRIIDQTGTVIGRDQPWICDGLIGWHVLSWSLLFGNHIGHSTVMMKKEYVLGLGGYAEWATRAQDYELWTRLAFKYRAIVIPEVLVLWRSHANGITSTSSREQWETVSATLQRAHERLLGHAVPRQDSGHLHELVYRKEYRIGAGTARALKLLEELRMAFLALYRPATEARTAIENGVAILHQDLLRITARERSWLAWDVVAVIVRIRPVMTLMFCARAGARKVMRVVRCLWNRKAGPVCE